MINSEGKLSFQLMELLLFPDIFPSYLSKKAALLWKKASISSLSKNTILFLRRFKGSNGKIIACAVFTKKCDSCLLSNEGNLYEKSQKTTIDLLTLNRTFSLCAKPNQKSDKKRDWMGKRTWETDKNNTITTLSVQRKPYLCRSSLVMIGQFCGISILVLQYFLELC